MGRRAPIGISRQPLLHFLGDQVNTLNDTNHFGDIHNYGHSRKKSYIRQDFKVGFSAVKSKTIFISWALFACLVLSSPSAFCADVHENTLYSLQFKSVSISEALKQIAETTGIKIVTPKQLGNQVITKSYKNQTIERILKDMFRDMNFALVWSYGEKGIDSVKIVALEKGSAAGARYSPEAARPTIRDYRAARPPAQRQAPPKRGLSPPRRSTVDTEPEDTEQEVSAEQEELEGDQEEAEPEEEGKEAMSSSEESDEEAPSGTERKRRP
jgi:hypothetical protein